MLAPRDRYQVVTKILAKSGAFLVERWWKHLCQWVTLAEAAQALAVSQRTLCRWAQTGKLPIRRDVRPNVVDIPGPKPDVSDATAGELERSQAENERLHGRVAELERERDYSGRWRGLWRKASRGC